MKRLLVLTAAVIFTSMPLLASDITPLQIMFVAKTMFPEATDVTVLIAGSQVSDAEATFGRAAAQTKLNPKVFIVDDSKGVGEAVRQVGDGSVILVLNDGVLNDKSTQLFILKKCKEKQASLITTSKEYANLGALAGLYKDETKKIVMSINLKHNAHLAGKFTPEFQEKLHVREVIE